MFLALTHCGDLLPLSVGDIDRLVQERCNSSALVMELHLSCTNASISIPSDTTVNWGNICCSDNGLLPVQCQAIFYTSSVLLLIGPLKTHFSDMSVKIQYFS